MAHKGTSTFIMQRFTAALMIPLAIWFLISVVSHLGADYAAARAWAGQWWNGLLLALFVSVGAWHMRIGLEEIIADYIHGGIKKTLSALNWLIAISVIAGALWSVYNISFAG
ncbi:succinate dehydrogenase, hydrophobic membrane anchor protein [Hyphococcus flavus]|uniref:Succinate dehydrogenase hydrophobic membrane anchor subunit n=1 Tax=Hyphococcus flavus TaxID=1866326 RepID=A0AAE9ZDW2_9PROT|nr:succinate dehydrogenase, hydrophobic membrane anchor protein [Hyphococcus flavus]WDI33019.1 succinate dehydrogenase, hydrophobic membrane anchor protein [Hyphococcus flavus]